MFTCFLLLTVVTQCWMSPFHGDNDENSILLEDLKDHLMGVQEELDTAAQEYAKEVDTSQYEDDSVYAQNVFPADYNVVNADDEAEHQKIIRHRNSLNDREAILQHLHLIHHSNLDAKDESEYDYKAVHDNFADQEAVDEASASNIAMEIQGLMDNQNNLMSAESQDKNKGGSTKKKLTKLTNKMFDEIVPKKTVNSQEFVMDDMKIHDAANEIISNLDSLKEN